MHDLQERQEAGHFRSFGEVGEEEQVVAAVLHWRHDQVAAAVGNFGATVETKRFIELAFGNENAMRYFCIHICALRDVPTAHTAKEMVVHSGVLCALLEIA